MEEEEYDPIIRVMFDRQVTEVSMRHTHSLCRVRCVALGFVLVLTILPARPPPSPAAVSQADFNTPSKAKAQGGAAKEGHDDDSEGAGTRMGQGGEGGYGDSDDDPVLPPKKAKVPPAFGALGMGAPHLGGMAPSSTGLKGVDEEDDDEDDDGSMGDEEDDDSNPSMGRGPGGSSYILGAKGWGERPPSQGAGSAPQQVQALPTADDGGEMEL